MPEGLAKKRRNKKMVACAPAVKKGRPRSRSSRSDTSNKRFRGSLGDRTCPLCKKVFTSALGKDYHASTIFVHLVDITEDNENQHRRNGWMEHSPSRFK